MLLMFASLKLLNVKLNVLSQCENCKTDVKNATTAFMLSFIYLPDSVLIKNDIKITFTAVIVKEFMI